MLHHASYNRESMKLHIKRVNMKDRKVIEKLIFEVEIKGLKPLGVLKVP